MVSILLRFGRDRRGFVTLFVLLYCLIAFAGLIAEYFRIMDLAQEAEFVLQRGVNLSIVDTLLDSSRRDGILLVRRDDVERRLRDYLSGEANLDGSYRRLTRDGDEVWRIEFDRGGITVDEENASLSVKGVVITKSIMSILTGEIRIPFSLSSRATRFDSY